jgi:hypothetical protein
VIPVAASPKTVASPEAEPELEPDEPESWLLPELESDELLLQATTTAMPSEAATPKLKRTLFIGKILTTRWTAGGTGRTRAL